MFVSFTRPESDLSQALYAVCHSPVTFRSCMGRFLSSLPLLYANEESPSLNTQTAISVATSNTFSPDGLVLKFENQVLREFSGHNLFGHHF
ncbi:hypothetical protein TNCT_723641 [Trichonephila clavata]|uniref:Uncharacterized protein n=1 Tax=Trichonephila clavata TaxID=2740835 RepID=A0A8X6F3T5_TRICU|nr:hypothetical protein TNCT_723641 [Trichonephila clavata]